MKVSDRILEVIKFIFDVLVFLAGKCSCKEDCIKTGKCTCDSSCQCNKATSKCFDSTCLFYFYLICNYLGKGCGKEGCKCDNCKCPAGSCKCGKWIKQQVIDEHFFL